MKEQSKNAQITIPCHWDESVISKILNKNENSPNKVVEIYGVLSNGGPIGHGRSPDSVVSIEKQDAINFRNKIKKLGLKFTYLLNAPFSFQNNNESRKEIDEYLDWIINDFKADAVTISSYELMKYVRNQYKGIDIHISTIAGVKTDKDLEKYLDINPNRLVPHHDVGKSWKELEKIIKIGHKNDIDVEIMTTESCLFNCFNRERHYQYLSNKSQDCPFHISCNSQKLIRPREILLAGGMIRPEDVNFYLNMGIKFIKITGRSKPSQWLPEVVEAYQTGKFEGNLFRILGIDPTLNAEDWMFLDNTKLNGFISSFPKNNLSKSVEYCDRWITNLYQNGDFRLTDGTTYKIENSHLVLDLQGEKSKKIIKKELLKNE